MIRWQHGEWSQNVKLGLVSGYKFKVEPDCEEQFLKAQHFSDEHMSHFLSLRAVQIDDGLIAHISKCESLG